MLVAIESAEEAATAIAGGADRIVVKPAGGKEGLLPVECERICQIAAGRCPVSLWMQNTDAGPAWPVLRDLCGADEVYLPPGRLPALSADLGGARPIALLRFAGTAQESVFDTAAGAGFAGVLLGVDAGSRRLLEVQTVGQLQQQVRWARSRKLTVGFAGTLEAPDIPRLLALAPDVLVFDGTVRQEGHDTRRLASERLCLVRDLIPKPGPAEPSNRFTTASLDRIFVRDWTVEIHIGAYAHEHAAQRVRFTVEVEVMRVAARAADMRHVVTYDLITDAISRATVEHVDLVETVAEDIAGAILAHPRTMMVDITVEKLDLGPGSLGCRLVRRRDQRP